MRKIISYLVFASLIIILICGSLFITPPQKALAYDRNFLCTDSGFVNSSAMSAAGVQSFLNSNGSFLRNYSENGRTAAQIIHAAAVENGINPLAILAMIQKEEGLIAGVHSITLNQTRLDWAMGYGYTDSVIYTQYRGFTNQIEYGTWQLKRNFSYWATRTGSPWLVGKTMNIDGTNVTFGNKCTSAQYRYTPHLGVNFMKYFDTWGGNGIYAAQLVSQGPRSGLGIYGVALLPGQQFTAWVSFKNTGTSTWSKSGPTPIQLGTSEPYDRGSAFFGGANLRGKMTQDTVAPGQIGTFSFVFTAPSREGTYVEHFQPVVEYVGRLGSDVSWNYTVSRGLVAAQSSGVYVNQGPKSGAGSLKQGLASGQTATLWVQYRNTGKQIWFKNGLNATHLGTATPIDRSSVFFGNTNRRGRLVENQVRPGQIGTFEITVTAPSRRADYVEHFQLVTENVKWFGSDISWFLRVR